ncbi:MAG TPA: flotillin-like FloA family protein, partial [Planctomycetota bacterium]|nr:flotillin-like FloA family protein [Planctomycetota bacterium]
MIDLLAQTKELKVGGIILLALLGLMFFIIMMKYGLLWVQAIASGARVGLLDLVGMSLRKVSPVTIVTARIMSVKAGIPVNTPLLEA